MSINSNNLTFQVEQLFNHVKVLSENHNQIVSSLKDIHSNLSTLHSHVSNLASNLSDLHTKVIAKK